MHRCKLPIALLAPVLLISCSSTRATRRPYLVMECMDAATRHLQAGEPLEASQLYQTVLLADPFNEEARRQLGDIEQKDRCIMKPSVLGKNLVRAPKRESKLARILLYPVNRVLDVLDIVSFSVGPAGGLYVGVHATRAVQASAGAGGGMQVGWWQKRELAAGAGHVAGISLLPFSLEGEGHTRVGTRGVQNTGYGVPAFSRPSDFAYQQYRDYWGIGARAIVLIVGAEVEIHPVEIADAVAGLLFVDLLRDDLGHTRSLNLTDAEMEAMQDLLATLSPSELRARMRGRAIEPVTRPGQEAEPEAAPGAPPIDSADRER